MRKKNLTLILAVILIICFFLPYFSYASFQASGYDIVFGKGGGMSGATSSSERYIWLVLPVSALLLVVDALLDLSIRDNLFFMLFPLIGLLYIAFRIWSWGAVASGTSPSMGEMMDVMGYGFWISVVAAVVLPFTKE